MATIKSYTSITQSRKLAEILPIESADMYYPYDLDSRKVLSIPIVKDDYCMPCIHCWSLAALLGVLQYPTLLQREDKKWECTAWIDFTKPHSIPPKGSPIDACYEMIMRLHELKML